MLTSWLMSNLTQKMNQTSIEINGNLHFSQIWDGKSFWNFTNCLKYENEYFSDENIWWDYSPSIYNLQFYQNLKYQ